MQFVNKEISFFFSFSTQFKREIAENGKRETIGRRKQKDTPIKRIVPKKGWRPLRSATSAMNLESSMDVRTTFLRFYFKSSNFIVKMSQPRFE